MLIVNNEEALRMPCDDALPDEVGHIVDLLDSELIRSERLGRPGIGLAAPQIGIYKRVAVVRLNHLKLNLVNCKIKNYYDQKVFKSEGCLSFPSRIEDTLRYQEIHIVDNIGDYKDFIATGLTSVVCQHEMDHWNGKIFFDLKTKEKPVIFNKKPGPNEPCICGSNKKFKKCCWR